MNLRHAGRSALFVVAACALPALAAAQAAPRAQGGATERDRDARAGGQDGRRGEHRRPIIILINHVPGAWDYPHNTGNLQLVGGYVQQAPPAPQFEPVPSAPPGPAMVWVAGHYQWDGATYNWVLGQWVPVPGGFTRWEAGRWDHNELGWYWVPGKWIA